MAEKFVAASGATRSAGTLPFSLIPAAALRVLAQRFALGAEKYGALNWVKGFPYSVVLDHLMSHVVKFAECRTTDEDGEAESDLDNLAAILWGASVLAYYVEHGRTDLDDRDWEKVREAQPDVAPALPPHVHDHDHPTLPELVHNHERVPRP